MIVRILTEGQWDVPDGEVDGLNALDTALTAVVESGDEAAFGPALAALLDRVRSVGTPVPDDSLEPSECALPPAGATIDEVRELLTDEGLVPGT